MELFISTFLKIFFIMTPFFVLSVFLTMTSDVTIKEKRALAIKVTISVIITSLILVFFGKHIFSVFVKHKPDTCKTNKPKQKR